MPEEIVRDVREEVDVVAELGELTDGADTLTKSAIVRLSRRGSLSESRVSPLSESLFGGIGDVESGCHSVAGGCTDFAAG